MPIAKIFQIELTNYCNLSCPYCPLPNSDRAKGYMNERTYLNILDHMEMTGQRLLVLHNFGEPLLHPELINFVRLAFDRGFLPGFSSNGIALTESKFNELLDAGLSFITISVHSKKSAEIYEKIRPVARQKHCLIKATAYTDTAYFNQIDADVELLEKHDWAGTAANADPFSKIKNGHNRCDFIKHNFFTVLYDGTVCACCFDERGSTKRGTIEDLKFISHQNSYDLCKTCDGAKLRFRSKLLSSIFSITSKYNGRRKILYHGVYGFRALSYHMNRLKKSLKRVSL
jgi:organic radical activating enzyme